AELIQAYRDHVECGSLARKTKQKYRRVLNDVEQMTKACPAQAIDFRFMDRYRAKRLKTVKESTVCDEVVIIQQMMKFGVQRKLIASNPLAGYKLKEPKAPRQPCWTHEQGEQIVSEAPVGVYGVAFRVLLNTGMRSGELTHLQWRDVDFENNVIHIREKTWKYGDEVRSWRPKTGDQRAVPMSEDVVTALNSLPRKSDWVFLAPASWKYQDGQHRLTTSRLLKAVKRVLKRLSLEGHVHTFRHTFISHALTSGIPEATVRSWVGHVDDKIIRRYTHIADRVSQQHMKELTQKRAKNSDRNC
ncbi:MAG TPA: site-specific integrase, partial [Planctomycetaceae bacterium]|nr:site-specific integrase [Planctomycetaceae bacterium]